MEEIRKYPVGMQTFSDIREGNYVYVDKTRYIVDFLRNGSKYVFLSRPRRFGKSLFVSTLQAYYEGRKELFDGLALGEYEKEWVKRPVLHFDMSTAKNQTPEGLEEMLGYMLSEYEQVYGRDELAVQPSQRLQSLVKRAYKKTGQKVVVLIDEYDAPLLDVVHEKESLMPLRLVMRKFYSPLKYLDPWLEFTFITGITKFSQLSIFSEINNLDNISMFDQYSAICGISKTELLTVMKPDVELLAKSLGKTFDETVAELSSYYDGYHFSKKSEDVFNPFSLVKALRSKEVAAYWFSSGTPAYIINTLRKHHVGVMDIEQKSVGVDDFDVSPEQMTSALPLLYQSGYVTIKGYDKPTKLYQLALPNQEIRVGLYGSLLPHYLTDKSAKANTTIAKMSVLVKKGDMDAAFCLLNDFLETVPYCDNTNYEGHWQQTLYIMFALLTNYSIHVEPHTAKGRIDITMETADTIYVMELKFNKSAEEALAQIEAKHYVDAFKMSGKKVVKIGLNFSVKDEVNSLEWEIVS